MKRKEILSMLFLAAAVMALNPAPTAAQSVGGTQSERSGESDIPVPPQAKPGDSGKFGSGSRPPTGTAQGNKDTSVGGTQSQRAGDDNQTPLPKGSHEAGASDQSRGGYSRRSASESRNVNGQQEVRLAQEALKNQGHDPGPIDGVMGSQTRQALKEFQSANGLKQTGILDAQTKQKLNIEGSSSGSAAGSTRESGSMGNDSSPRQKESSPMGR